LSELRSVVKHGKTIRSHSVTSGALHEPYSIIGVDYWVDHITGCSPVQQRQDQEKPQFAGDDGEDVVARNRPAEIHVGRSWQTQKHPS
jgi:hypothetical protein